MPTGQARAAQGNRGGPPAPGRGRVVLVAAPAGRTTARCPGPGLAVVLAPGRRCAAPALGLPLVAGRAVSAPLSPPDGGLRQRPGTTLPIVVPPPKAPIRGRRAREP